MAGYIGNKAVNLSTSGADISGTAVTDGLTVAGNVSVDGGTIKLDGNYPVGSGNVGLGDAALDDGSLSGDNNTAIGSLAMSANTTGTQNAAFGQAALDANTTFSAGLQPARPLRFALPRPNMSALTSHGTSSTRR